jgi:NADH-quinone oxidoreductase subunit J
VSTIVFWFLAVLGIASAVGLITNRNSVYCALFTVLNFFCIAGLYLTLQAQFLAVVQIMVYAGAIMVLFLFVVMLLNLGRESDELHRLSPRRGLSFLLGGAFFAEMAYILTGFGGRSIGENGKFAFGTVEELGAALMKDYTFSFEMISVVLLAALMGALVIAKKA